MQIVIDIPQKILNRINSNYTEMFWSYVVKRAIQNGTPLPKGHGKLIDVRSFDDYVLTGDISFQRLLDDIPAVIEADSGDEE